MILIIGGSGFIGYYLHQGFVKSKKRVISTYNTNKIEEENFIRLDVNNKKNLGKLINNFEQRINLIKNLQEIKSFNTNQLILKHLNDKI